MKQVIPENRIYLRWIYGASIAVPLLVGLLLFSPFKISSEAIWIKQLPLLNALLNSTTSLLLICALIAIKLKRVNLHRNLMLTSLLLGVLFLISYIIYHSSSDSTVYGDVNHNGVLDLNEKDELGYSRGVYLSILLSHIGFSIVVVPFVLLAFYFALTDQIPRHKKIVKYTYPIWLYVSITGVLVYFMISPYYI